jgi:hypothetical protein
MRAAFVAMKEAALRVLDEHWVRLAGHVLDEMIEAEIQAIRAANVERITRLMRDEADARHGLEVGRKVGLL